MGKTQRWSYTSGRRPNRVRVYERADSGSLFLATWDADQGREVRRSLGHSDREWAKDLADDLAVQLRRGEQAISRRADEGPVLREIFARYLREKSPDKSESSRRSDRRNAELWTRVLGADFDLSKLSRRQWDRFLRDRASGAIDARGNPVAEGKRRPVSARAVQTSCVWLRAVCRWAMTYRDEDDRLLLERDPTAGLDVPRQTNPKRPVASHDRVDAIREVYRQPRMQVDGTLVETFLPEIFELAVGTGRRISAICSLRYEDLQLEKTEEAPYGAILWPADTDKMNKSWRCPISPEVRKALQAALLKRNRVGPGPLFPDPKKPEEPIGYDKAAHWLQSAERLAGLEPQEGSLWHAYRRLWASARKDLPDVDVAQAGGWSSLEALKSAYQQPDARTMLKVVTHQAELREAR